MRQAIPIFKFLTTIGFVGSACSVQAEKIAVIDRNHTEISVESKDLHSEIRILDSLHPATPPTELTVGRMACAAFFQNGARIIVASYGIDGNSVVINVFETNTGKELKTFEIPNFWISGYYSRSYEPHVGIGLARIAGTETFALAGSETPHIPTDEPLPCSVAVFDAEHVLGVTTMTSTLSLDSSFLAGEIPKEAALIVSGYPETDRPGPHVYQQLSVFNPDAPRQPGTLVREFTTPLGFGLSQDTIYMMGQHRDLTKLPNDGDLATTPPTKIPLTEAKGISNEYYPFYPFAVIPRGNGDLLIFNALAHGSPTGVTQVLIARLKEGQLEIGPEVSERVIGAKVSSDGKRLVVVSLDSPQVVVFSLPELKVTARWDVVSKNPTDFALE